VLRKSSWPIFDSPSGRNFLPKSNRRPRITSRSMSKRTRFETCTHLA